MAKTGSWELGTLSPAERKHAEGLVLDGLLVRGEEDERGVPSFFAATGLCQATLWSPAGSPPRVADVPGWRAGTSAGRRFTPDDGMDVRRPWHREACGGCPWPASAGHCPLKAAIASVMAPAAWAAAGREWEEGLAAGLERRVTGLRAGDATLRELRSVVARQLGRSRLPSPVSAGASLAVLGEGGTGKRYVADILAELLEGTCPRPGGGRAVLEPEELGLDSYESLSTGFGPKSRASLLRALGRRDVVVLRHADRLASSFPKGLPRGLTDALAGWVAEGGSLVLTGEEGLADLLDRDAALGRLVPPEARLTLPPHGPELLLAGLRAHLRERGLDAGGLSRKASLPRLAAIAAGRPERNDELAARLAEDMALALAGEGRSRVRASDIPVPPPPADGSEVLAEMDALTGMAPVKEALRELLDLASLARRSGVGLQAPALHMAFTGNPGTGKTTVARLVGRILHAGGFLPTDRLTEVSAPDLVGHFAGQTAERTKALVERARGGVLFIDEAYALNTGTHAGGGSLGQQALAELLLGMENHRDDLVVILAGYGEEMERLISLNPGLRSRLGRVLEFPDFTPDELAGIFARQAERSGMTLGEGTEAAAREELDRARREPDFGNARTAIRLFELSLLRHARSVRGVRDRERLLRLEAADVAELPRPAGPVRHPLGFG